MSKEALIQIKQRIKTLQSEKSKTLDKYQEANEDWLQRVLAERNMQYGIEISFLENIESCLSTGMIADQSSDAEYFWDQHCSTPILTEMFESEVIEAAGKITEVEMMAKADFMKFAQTFKK